LQATNVGVEPALFGRIHGIEPFGDLPASVLGDKVSQSGGVQPAARHAEPLAQGLGRGEELIRYRQRDFHTLVIPE
jgi:hypothetical protein